MKTLLHVCCAPCAIYPLQKLKEEKAQIAGFFYNPNIHPSDEYQKRKESVMDYADSEAIELVIPDYDEMEYFDAVNSDTEKPARCFNCWELRLEQSADFAKENGFDSFTTTLLVSPYQDHQRIKEIGEKTAESIGIDFFYEDFRQGFRQAQDKAKEIGLYRQKYCGCKYSLE